MGSFILKLQAVGGHGCQREIKIPEGQTEVEIPRCAFRTCPDCRGIEALEDLLRHTGSSFEKGEIIHWPQDANGGILEELRWERTWGENFMLKRYRKRNF